MSLIRALKRFFFNKKEEKNPVRLRKVSNEELLGRLQRGMPIEHITCDEYIPVPKDKRVHPIIMAQERKAKVKVVKEKKKEYSKVKASNYSTASVDDLYQNVAGNNYRTGSYEAQIGADNYISGIKPSYSSGFTPELLKEAIEDAKAVRETARINAELAMDEAFKKNRKYVQINNRASPQIILPIKKDKISGLELDDFDLNKIFAQRRVKVYDNEKW